MYYLDIYRSTVRKKEIILIHIIIISIGCIGYRERSICIPLTSTGPQYVENKLLHTSVHK